VVLFGAAWVAGCGVDEGYSEGSAEGWEELASVEGAATLCPQPISTASCGKTGCMNRYLCERAYCYNAIFLGCATAPGCGCGTTCATRCNDAANECRAKALAKYNACIGL
jgi:hypothetical protein